MALQCFYVQTLCTVLAFIATVSSAVINGTATVTGCNIPGCPVYAECPLRTECPPVSEIQPQQPSQEHQHQRVPICGGSPNLVPLYAYYNEKCNDHYYTIDYSELGAGKNGYVLNPVEFQIWQHPQRGTVPLFAYFNPREEKHVYITDFLHYGHSKHGYIFETIVGYIYAQTETGVFPIYHFRHSSTGDIESSYVH